MSKQNYELGEIGEGIGRTYLRDKGYKEYYIICRGERGNMSPFDFISKETNEIIEIKTRKLPAVRPYAFDFTMRQLEYYNKYKENKNFLVLVVILHPNLEYEIRVFNLDEDFIDINRKMEYTVFNGLRRVRLTLKKKVRTY